MLMKTLTLAFAIRQIRLNQNLIWLILIAVLSKFLPYVLIPFYVDIFGPVGYGEIVLYESVVPVAILVLLFQSQIKLSIVYHKSKGDKSEVSNYLHSTIGLSFLFLLVMCVLAFIGNQVVWELYKMSLTDVVFLLCSLYVSALVLLFQNLFLTMRKSKYVLVSEVVKIVTWVIVLFQLKDNNGWYVRLMMQLLGGLVSIGVLIYFLREYLFPIKFGKQQWNTLKTLLIIGSPLVIYQISQVYLETGDRFFIESILGSEVLANYAINYQIAILPFLVFKVFQRDLQPKLFKLFAKAESTIESVNLFIRKYVLLYGFVSIVILILVYILQDYISNIVNLKVNMLMILILQIGFTFRVIYALYSSVIFYLEKNRLILIISFTSSIVSAIFLFSLLSEHGMLYAAIITSISYMIVGVLSLYHYTKLITKVLSYG